MNTRREFLSGSLAAFATGLTGLGMPPYARAAHGRIQSIVRRDETILRLGGEGDNLFMTWTGLGRQVVGVDDGAGWFSSPKGYYNGRLWEIRGSPSNAVFAELPGYPELFNVLDTEQMTRYYGLGMLGVDGHIYQFLGTPNHRFEAPDGTAVADSKFVGAKLIYSPDGGRVWLNQDGSTPVHWEPWGTRSRANMLFFEEPDNVFSLISVLQMGRDYTDNQDGYIYLYAPNGNIEGAMNELVMCRVSKTQVLHRSEYEFFAGLKADGSAYWNRNIKKRAIVHTFPEGWVNRLYHPWSWIPSVVYNKPLGLYLMANWGTGVTPDGLWFGKPSYLGFWIAGKPWGPWEQVYEDSSWAPGNDHAARAYSPQISSSWLSDDGMSFWLVWSDFQKKLGADVAKRRFEEIKLLPPEEKMRAHVKFRREFLPYYAFNTQRYDIVLA